MDQNCLRILPHITIITAKADGDHGGTKSIEASKNSYVKLLRALITFLSTRLAKEQFSLIGHCPLDIEAVTLANISFNGGYVRIHFQIYLFGIGHTILRL